MVSLYCNDDNRQPYGIIFAMPGFQILECQLVCASYLMDNDGKCIGIIFSEEEKYKKQQLCGKTSVLQSQKTGRSLEKSKTNRYVDHVEKVFLPREAYYKFILTLA